jgi:hypothetical protein
MRQKQKKVAKPQQLSIARAQSASKEKLDSYYKELSTILTKYNLHDKPEHIFKLCKNSGKFFVVAVKFFFGC